MMEWNEEQSQELIENVVPISKLCKKQACGCKN